jgi:predicted DCC family thiol-disulfide oxidoreductase YuxK
VPGHGWLVLYDADCGLCRALLAGLLHWDRGRQLQPLALQSPEADALLAGLAPAERLASWHLVSPAGQRYSGGGALPPLLRLLPGGRAPAAAFARFPRLADGGYRWVAEHRTGLSRLLPARLKRHADPLRATADASPEPGAAPPAR